FWPNFDGLSEEVSAVVVFALSTVWLTVLLVLALKLPSLPYSAVIGCEPTASAAVLKVATPPLRVPVPIVVPPSLKVTVPLGVPAPGATAATLRASVLFWPNLDGLSEELSVVVVFALSTTWLRVLLLLVLKLESPE